jgi:hypothetical protein
MSDIFIGMVLVKICYVDEAGCTGRLPSSTSDIQPTLVVAGVMVDYNKLHAMTESLLDLKQRFSRNIAPSGASHLDWIRKEIKGSELRKDACEGGRNIKRHRKIYISKILKICESIDARLTGRIWIKGAGQPINGVNLYVFYTLNLYRLPELPCEDKRYWPSDR